MKSMIALFLLLSASGVFASTGLVIHTTEVGVAKFHRQDNKIHPYPAQSSWVPFILPDGAAANQNLIQKNADASYTVFFLTLEDMMTSVAKLAQSEQKPISLLSIHGHGLPGAMWFPRDTKDMNSLMCYQWRSAASGTDQGNYDQYYSPVSASEIQQIRNMASHDNNQMGCTTGLPEWQKLAAAHPEFVKSFASDAQVSFLSCVVGLGHAGEVFTQGVAALLFPAGSTAKVQTSVNLGLGDWSMPEGMGFWDYVSDDQLRHDNATYPKDRQDREMAQKGTVRLVQYNNGWSSRLMANQDFMIFNRNADIQGEEVAPEIFESPVLESHSTGPEFVRVPGTAVSIEVRH